jgi:putative chitinase
MKLHELFDDTIDEGLAKWAGLAGLGAAALFGNPTHSAADTRPKPEAVAQQRPQAKTSQVPQATPGAAARSAPSSAAMAKAQKQQIIVQAALAAGIRGKELAALLAQIAHESGGFSSMTERGTDDYFTRLYDIKGNTEKAKELGNVHDGDGALYKGRGFIHLTGRYNYNRAGKKLNLDLENHPELAEDPKHAAKIALWFWKNRVKPNVSNWDDVRSVTYRVNSGLEGLDRRQAYYDHYKNLLVPRTMAKTKVKPKF